MGKTVKEIIEEEYGTNIDEYKDDFTALVVEAEDIIELTEEDKKFLENFTKVTNLSIVSCKLKSLNNFPDFENLERLELADNNIAGGLGALSKYPNLKNLKLCGNKIKSIDDVAELKPLSKLENLDFIETPLSKTEDYKKKIWELFENLKVLDNFDKDGEECLSELDADEADGEGEGDLGDFIDPKDLTEEEKQRLEKQGLKFIEGEGEDYDDEGEEQEEEDTAKAGEKRAREDDPEESGNKRQKTEE
ncbi:unnamed protein product [Moneuplotes crassus]|uniref:Acidic leucine-rich nuclear phosphoprotein 32 family member A n=2 Tax=Euplotes crassus TaxID=5936 RepID=A0AAD1XLF0_EUPCR|nr:unnamed protein product [Moneuplotes crassus]